MKYRLKTEIIENYIKENNLTKTEFCRGCKVSLYLFNKIMKGYLNFDVRILLRIARLIKIEVYKLFDETNKNSIDH